MTMNHRNRNIGFWVLALLVAGYFATSSAAKAANVSTGGSPEVTQLLTQVKTEALALEHDADVLALWTNSKQAKWQSHAERLHAMRNHVNDAGRLLAKLHQVRESASPWQQNAIDRVTPLLKELAANTETAINHLNDNKRRIYFPPYTDYAKAGYGLAKELATVISDYVEYGEHTTEVQRLQERLQPAAG